MYENLRFGCDGVLRLCLYNPLARSEAPILVSLEAYLNSSVSKGDFLAYLMNSVDVEEGTTLLAMLRALMPWEALVNPIAQMNLSEWIAAMDEELQEPPDVSAYLGLQAVRLMQISAVPDYETIPRSPRATPSADGTIPYERSLFGMGKALRTNRLEFGDRWDVSLLAKPDHPANAEAGEGDFEGQRVYSTSCTAPGVMAQLPVFLEKRGLIYDETTHYDGGFLDAKRRGILRKGNAAVRNGMLEIEVIPNLLDAVLRGLLWDLSFYGSPNAAKLFQENLIETVSKLKDREEAVRTGYDVPVTQTDSQITETSPDVDSDADSDADNELLEGSALKAAALLVACFIQNPISVQGLTQEDADKLLDVVRRSLNAKPTRTDG